jgi:hypothetical protein
MRESIDRREDCSSPLITRDKNQTDLHDVDNIETKKREETRIEKIRSSSLFSAVKKEEREMNGLIKFISKNFQDEREKDRDVDEENSMVRLEKN